MASDGNRDVSAKTALEGDRFHHLKEIRLRIWIPSELAGKVVGKQGLVIQHIQKETNVQCRMLPAVPIDMDTYNLKPEVLSEIKQLLDSIAVSDVSALWAPGIITGLPQNVWNAFHVIRNLTGDEIDDVVLEFPIPRNSHHLLVDGGKSAPVVLRKLSADFNVRVLVPDGINDKSLFVSFEGKFTNVFRALDVALGIVYEGLVITPDVEVPRFEPKEHRVHDAPQTSHNTLNAHRVYAETKEPDRNYEIPQKETRENPKEFPEKVKKPAVALPSAVMTYSRPFYSEKLFNVLPTSGEYQLEAFEGSQSVEIIVDIPTTIVGLLLKSREDYHYADSEISPVKQSLRGKHVVAQVQSCTRTMISKIIPAGIERKTEQEETAEEAESVKEPLPEYVASSSYRNTTATSAEVEGKSGAANQKVIINGDVVKFRIRGSDLALVEEACTAFRRIVGGVGIRDVLADLYEASNKRYSAQRKPHREFEHGKGKGGRGMFKNKYVPDDEKELGDKETVESKEKADKPEGKPFRKGKPRKEHEKPNNKSEM